MKQILLKILASSLIFSFFGALAWVALDSYEQPDFEYDRSSQNNGIGRAFITFIKGLSNTFGDKVVAGIFVAAGIGAVIWFLWKLKQEENSEQDSE